MPLLAIPPYHPLSFHAGLPACLLPVIPCAHRCCLPLLKALKDLAGPLIQRSRVSVGDRTPLRTSWGMFITGQLAAGPVSRQLDAKVQHLADLGCRLMGRKPLELGEATQIVR